MSNPENDTPTARYLAQIMLYALDAKLDPTDPSGSPTWCELCCEDHAAEQAPPFDEHALDQTDSMLDMTGAFVQSTAAVLRIRAEVATKHEQYDARWLAVQHGGRPVERARVLAKRETWRQALELIDRVIGERLS